MLKVTSVLQSENYIQFPEALYTEWKIQEESDLYISIDKNNLILSKAKCNHAAIIRVYVGFGIILPELYVRTMGIQIGSEVSLTLDDDTVVIHKGNVVHLFSASSNKDKLIAKLNREFDTNQGSNNIWLYEDIHMFLILNEWDDTVIDNLLTKENILKELAFKLRNDDEFDEFFEKKMKELTLLYASE